MSGQITPFTGPSNIALATIAVTHDTVLHASLPLCSLGGGEGFMGAARVAALIQAKSASSMDLVCSLYHHVYQLC